MVSLRSFLETSGLQDQLQTRIAEHVSLDSSVTSIKSQAVKEIITSFIQIALENYIAQIYVEGVDFSGPEELQSAIEAITFYLSPETKSKIISNCNDEEAYQLGRTYYGLSKRSLPC